MKEMNGFISKTKDLMGIEHKASLIGIFIPRP
jgi:hypothetical protein